MRGFLPVVAFLLLTRLAAAQTGTITTVAGGGPNNLPALSSNLALPRAVAIDASGNYYIATSQNRVFKVDPSGTLTVLAGDGTRGFAGDGGAAAHAKLNSPAFELAVDSGGSVFFPDSGNHRVRRVDGATGVITTVAGNGNAGFGGDGGAAISAALPAIWRSASARRPAPR